VITASAALPTLAAVPAATEFPPFGQDPWWLVVLKVVGIFAGVVVEDQRADVDNIGRCSVAGRPAVVEVLVIDSESNRPGRRVDGGDLQSRTV
jgi:hypothetical protein